jgi:glycosyltransferase involved in cell wall biosynthesis
VKEGFEDFQVILEKFCAKKSCFTIAVSKRVRDELISMEIPIKRIFVVPNGVDIRQFAENSREAMRVRRKLLLEKNNIVLYVGRIVRSKGLDSLIDAAPGIAAKHPDVKFVITGPVSYYQSGTSTPYYRELKEKIELRQMSELFVFTGAVSERDLVGLYSACDMLVLPSFSEAFGMVLAEAMSCGKPVIGSRIGGIVDVINDGKDGYLTPPGQPKELSSKIIHLLEQPEERKRMGRNAARHVRDQFDWSKIAKRIMEIYDKAIREY